MYRCLFLAVFSLMLGLGLFFYGSNPTTVQAQCWVNDYGGMDCWSNPDPDPDPDWCYDDCDPIDYTQPSPWLIIAGDINIDNFNPDYNCQNSQDCQNIVGGLNPNNLGTICCDHYGQTIIVIYPTPSQPIAPQPYIPPPYQQQNPGCSDPTGFCGDPNPTDPGCETLGNCTCEYYQNCPSNPGPSNPGPSNPGPSNPGPSIPPPPPSLCNIQGFKISKPGNNAGGPQANTAIRLNGGYIATNNPYRYTLYGGSQVIISASDIPGYTVGYTVCTNRTDCHNDSNIRPGNSVQITCPANGFVDLWWHYSPASCDVNWSFEGFNSASNVQVPIGSKINPTISQVSTSTNWNWVSLYNNGIKVPGGYSYPVYRPVSVEIVAWGVPLPTNNSASKWPRIALRDGVNDLGIWEVTSMNPNSPNRFTINVPQGFVSKPKVVFFNDSHNPWPDRNGNDNLYDKLPNLVRLNFDYNFASIRPSKDSQYGLSWVGHAGMAPGASANNLPNLLPANMQNNNDVSPNLLPSSFNTTIWDNPGWPGGVNPFGVFDSDSAETPKRVPYSFNNGLDFGDGFRYRYIGSHTGGGDGLPLNPSGSENNTGSPWRVKLAYQNISGPGSVQLIAVDIKTGNWTAVADSNGELIVPNGSRIVLELQTPAGQTTTINSLKLWKESQQASWYSGAGVYQLSGNLSGSGALQADIYGPGNVYRRTVSATNTVVNFEIAPNEVFAIIGRKYNNFYRATFSNTSLYKQSQRVAWIGPGNYWFRGSASGSGELRADLWGPSGYVTSYLPNQVILVPTNHNLAVVERAFGPSSFSNVSLVQAPSFSYYQFTNPEVMNDAQLQSYFSLYGDRNVTIPEITVTATHNTDNLYVSDTTTYPSKSAQTYSVGAFSTTANCVPGYNISDTLACNGYFEYNAPHGPIYYNYNYGPLDVPNAIGDYLLGFAIGDRDTQPGSNQLAVGGTFCSPVITYSVVSSPPQVSLIGQLGTQTGKTLTLDYNLNQQGVYPVLNYTTSNVTSCTPTSTPQDPNWIVPVGSDAGTVPTSLLVGGNPPKVYTYTLTCSDNLGRRASDTVTFTVNPPSARPTIQVREGDVHSNTAIQQGQ